MLNVCACDTWTVLVSRCVCTCLLDSILLAGATCITHSKCINEQHSLFTIKYSNAIKAAVIRGALTESITRACSMTDYQTYKCTLRKYIPINCPLETCLQKIQSSQLKIQEHQVC